MTSQADSSGSTAARQISVFLLDDHEVVRRGVRDLLEAEPDKLAGGLGLGPRLLISEAGLRATGLLQPGSLVRWIYRVKLPDNAADDRAAIALADDARSAWPQAGWEVRNRGNASPQLERTISRFTVVPTDDGGWYCQGARHWNLDRPDPRQPGPR